jgi:hypothetical protein
MIQKDLIAVIKKKGTGMFGEEYYQRKVMTFGKTVYISIPAEILRKLDIEKELTYELYIGKVESD